MIYLDVNATSWPKIEEYDRVAERIRRDPRDTNVRSGLQLYDLDKSIRELIRERFKIPFKPGIIYTSGATEALNLAASYAACSNPHPPVLDATTHNALRLPFMKFSDNLELMENREVEYDDRIVALNLSSSFVPVHPHHTESGTKKGLYLPHLSNCCVVIDASQYMSWTADFSILEDAVSSGSSILIAFGFHKKLGMYPGSGMLVYDANRIAPDDIMRLTLGGGYPLHHLDGIHSYASSPWPAGTFDPVPYIAFNELMLSPSLLQEKTALPEQIEWALTIEELMGRLGAICRRQENTWCYCHEELSLSELSWNIQDSKEYTSNEVLWREGRFCCDYYFEELAAPHELEGFIRISI